ncbi:unnamed protein product [Orchesella dallaii]|uniref:Uncharacterized protein n=1 Tax=Orchesella dallaii TaxID=48710 RepID=A0ABP1QRI0_9HEXA
MTAAQCTNLQLQFGNYLWHNTVVILRTIVCAPLLNDFSISLYQPTNVVNRILPDMESTHNLCVSIEQKGDHSSFRFLMLHQISTTAISTASDENLAVDILV